MTSVMIEPPSWAVCANGEAFLEPVGTTARTHNSVNLSSSACFRIGRSPSSDVRLVHPTSSRKHALVFHHPNGSCYVVDCGSAHGTYINGVRAGGPVVELEGSGQANAIPHRVKRGAIVRFGGPGAPTFLLKSFSASLECLVQDLCCDTKLESFDKLPLAKATSSPTVADAPANGARPSSLPTLAPTTPRSTSSLPNSDEGSKSSRSPTKAVVTINTRINALGGGAGLSQEKRALIERVTSKFTLGSLVSDQIDGCLNGQNRTRSRERAFTEDRSDDFCEDILAPPQKRLRSATYPLSPERVNRSCMKAQDAAINFLEAPLFFKQVFTTISLICDDGKFGAERRRVKFQEEDEHFYPTAVTPDAS